MGSRTRFRVEVSSNNNSRRDSFIMSDYEKMHTLTTCILQVVSAALYCIVRRIVLLWCLYTGVTVVYKHHNNTIGLTLQHKAALTTCVYM